MEITIFERSGLGSRWSRVLEHTPRRRLRVLLSEGSSTSVRETLTVLGQSGHQVDICDPDGPCLARFPRLVARFQFHRCPPLRDDPVGSTMLATIPYLITLLFFSRLSSIVFRGDERLRCLS